MENAEAIKAIQELEKRVSELEKLLISKPESIKKQLSPREFIESKKPRNEIQSTLVIAYFVEKYKGTLAFIVDDLDVVFREAKQPVPRNINLNIYYNIQKGYIMEAKEKKGTKKAWCLTATGESFVENNLKEK